VTIATCKRKRRYDTKAEAEWARLGMRLRIGLWATRRLESYRCQCGWWHVGNSERECEMLENLLAERMQTK